MMKHQMSRSRQQILSACLLMCVCAFPAAAQSARPTSDNVTNNVTNGATATEDSAIQAQINSVYQDFYQSYRLGAGDVLGIFVDRHPEDSVPRVAVSPVGQVYYPLMGNVNVAGKTLDQLQEYFTTAISEYIREPRVTISLLEAQSSKYGLLGDIREPGVKIMTRPTRIFDAITAAGGITEMGNTSNVTVLRQDPFGSVQTFRVNVKKMMQGKASPEDNFFLQTGDTIIVHGNLYKSITKITNVMGITGFASFLLRGGR